MAVVTKDNRNKKTDISKDLGKGDSLFDPSFLSYKIIVCYRNITRILKMYYIITKVIEKEIQTGYNEII